jgi:hypothetical protein
MKGGALKTVGGEAWNPFAATYADVYRDEVERLWKDLKPLLGQQTAIFDSNLALLSDFKTACASH